MIACASSVSAIVCTLVIGQAVLADRCVAEDPPAKQAGAPVEVSSSDPPAADRPDTEWRTLGSYFYVADGQLDVTPIPAVDPSPTNGPSSRRVTLTNNVLEPVEPNVLRAPGPVPGREVFPEPFDESRMPPYFNQPIDPPLGYTGPSHVIPREGQQSSHFVPLEDRWRMGFKPWDRYGRGHPFVEDYPYQIGSIWNPYTQNVLKGDYPVLGQNTFLNITLSDLLVTEVRQVPTEANSFDSSVGPDSPDFFGNPNQSLVTNFTSLTVDLSHGNSAFKPADWRVRVTTVQNENYTDVNELGIISPNVTDGMHRYRSQLALQEWFVETKLADLSPDYDFLSARIGSQPFNSDFRGFIFTDTNRAVRLFGTRLSNREQFNILFFDQAEKDTNSTLNTFNDRHQKIFIANYYRQDCIFPGYTTQFSFHYNRDEPSMHFDDNGFLVRPDAAGIFQPHQVDACYFGWAGDGHINRLNINHAYYYVCGQDSLNPMAGAPLNISAQMAAVELSYDRDWVRFRTSGFYASGQHDHDFNTTTATGFDAIFDNPNFAGGQFSFWQRQAIKLQGVNLKNRFSLLPNLRSSKIEGQANFYNPGLDLWNFGMDFDVTPKTRIVTNCNLLWFDAVGVLEQFVFQGHINRNIGTDISLGTEYRPLLSNNVVLIGGLQCFVPGQGFHDLYDPIGGSVQTLFGAFLEATILY
jgi:hypothetical protein